MSATGGSGTSSKSNSNNTAMGETPRWLREKFELREAMRKAPSHPVEGSCDFVPPLELVGIYMVHGAVTRLAYRGEIDIGAAAYLNACLAVHAFTIVHHGTHESISQHNPAHAPFENTMYRLASALIFFDDGYREAHKEHHQKVGEVTDPDLMLAESPLPVLGVAIHATRTQPNYLNIGFGQKHRLERVHSLGILDWMVGSWVARRFIVNWHNVVLKMFTFEALEAIEEVDATLSNTLKATWRGTADELATILMALFFARYPHRNGIALENEKDSYYDNTFRGQSQVDLWMMGEGAHDLHHAKNDVSAAHLAKVRVEVEAASPRLKGIARGTWDVAELETTKRLPPTSAEREANAPDVAAFAIERTQRTLLAKKRLIEGSPVQAFGELGRLVLDNALHVCLTADREFLKFAHKKMTLDEMAERKGENNPIPVKHWPEKLFSDKVARILNDKRGALREEIQRVSREAGEKLKPGEVNTDGKIQRHYLDMFVAIFDTLVPAKGQAAFYRAFSKRFDVPSAETQEAKQAWLGLKKRKGEAGNAVRKAKARYQRLRQKDRAARRKGKGAAGPPDREVVIERLRAHLELPLPSNFLRSRNKYGAGRAKITRSRLVDIFLAPTTVPSKL